MWLEGLGQLKIQVTSSGIEAATFWLVTGYIDSAKETKTRM
jgi:hypothetical protein